MYSLWWACMGYRAPRPQPYFKDPPRSQEKQTWLESHFNIKNGNGQSLPAAQVTGESEAPAPDRKAKRTLSQKGAMGFHLPRRQAPFPDLAIVWLGNLTVLRKLAWSTCGHRPMGRGYTLEKIQVCSGFLGYSISSAPASRGQRVQSLLWPICCIVHWSLLLTHCLSPGLLPSPLLWCLPVLRANPRDGWSLPKSSIPSSFPPPPPPGGREKKKMILLWVWQLSLFQVSEYG